MHKPTKEEIETVLQSHAEWLKHSSKGKQADFSNMDLSDANLSRANLSRANLSRANLSDANLTDANLTDAYLTDADLSNANLFGANLSCTYLNKFKGNRYLIVSNHLPDCAPTELDLDRIIQKSYNFHCNYDDYLKLISVFDID